MPTKLHRLARETIDRLRADGSELSDSDIIELHELANKAEFGVSDNRILLYSGRKIGNIEIFPLTIGAKLWLHKTAGEWFEHDEECRIFATLYASAHARQLEALQFKNAKECRKKITAWAFKANVTETELRQAIDEIAIDNERRREKGVDLLQGLIQQIRENPCDLNLSEAQAFLADAQEDPPPIIPMIAILIHFYGKTREHWLWHESDSLCLELVKEASKIKAAQDGEKDRYDPTDPAILAYIRFQSKIKEIKARHNG